MIDLKRNLFPELSAYTTAEVSIVASAPQRVDRRKRKRNAITATKAVPGDSLAIVLLGKENEFPVKSKKASRQQEEISHNNQKDNKNQVFESSILMALGVKKNSCDNSERKKIQSTRQRKVNSGKNCTSKSMKNRRLLSNKTRSVLACFDTDTRPGSSSLLKKKIKKSESKLNKRNKKKKKVTKRVRLEESISNGDSLMTCLAESSVIRANSVLVGPKYSEKETKPCDQQKKRTKKRTTKARPSVVKSIETSDQGKKPQIHRKRSTVASCKVGGLGAFVGIAGEVVKQRNTRKEPRIRRLVSPLECDLKTNSLVSKNVKELNSSKQNIDKKEASDASKLDDVPSVIIISFPQQSKQLKCQASPVTISTIETRPNEDYEPTEDEIVTESSAMERRRSEGPVEITVSVQRRSKNHIDSSLLTGPQGNKNKTSNPKFSVGTKFQKDFKRHGWFLGEIVSFDSETGFYSVRYEDGDTEELEEYELEECKLQLDGSAVPKPNKEPQSINTSIVNKKDSERKGSTMDRSLSTASRKEDRGRSVPFEQNITLRRSRRRSNEPIRAHDTTQSSIAERQKKEVSSSFRRSKRRKSQPIRLIDSVSCDDKQAPRSTRSKKTKRSNQKSQMMKKQNSILKDSTSGNADVKENTNIDNPDMQLISNRPPSPSIREHKSSDKQHFDDALKALMPIEDSTFQSTCDQGQLQDDIFNSTPMRKLFARRLSNTGESDVTNQDEEKSIKAERRSRRKSIEPERYGYTAEFVAISTEKNTQDSGTKFTKKNPKPVSRATSSKKIAKSAIKQSKRKTKGGLAAKKRVRISIEPPVVTNIESHRDSKDIDIDPWTKADLRGLHRAHRLVDPTSFSFWEDVSEIIGDRSALECRHKWFSLAKTPDAKKSKPKKKGLTITTDTGNDRNVDDDIFNSTPMRSAFAIGENIDKSSAFFEELSEFSKINVGSAIKNNLPDHNDENQPSNDNQIVCPHGYKTYLQKMGRVMRKKDTRKKQTFEGINPPILAIGKKLSERTEEGDVQVKGRLSPGGTLRVDTFGDTDTEDCLDYEDETE